MTPMEADRLTDEQLTEIENAIARDQSLSPEQDNQLTHAIRALLRRDWAVRVLDACGRNYQVGLSYDKSCWSVWVGDEGWYRSCESADSARCAAAEAVFPTLSEAVRAELGECP